VFNNFRVDSGKCCRQCRRVLESVRQSNESDREPLDSYGHRGTGELGQAAAIDGRTNLKRRWLPSLLVIGCAVLSVMSIFQDCYYRGHRPIFGIWRYWSLGIQDGNLVGYSSHGEGDFFAELDQFIIHLHDPTLGTAPDLRYYPHNIGASGPVWLLLVISLGWTTFLEWRWRAEKRRAAGE
jgi:hypothetical protein